MKYLSIILFVLLFSSVTAQNKYTHLNIEMVTIPAGSFWMGSKAQGENYDEAPVHKVNLSRDILMGATEITNAQYEMFDPSHKAFRAKHGGFSPNDDDAVIFVSYNDAKKFCSWLSKKEGKTYRLPTEAEWEYACRANTYSPYWMADYLHDKYQKHQQIHRDPVFVNLQVAQTPPNPFGLYDMHGNVEEWCSDWYAPYPNIEQTNPAGALSGLFRVTRGGSHGTPIQFLRSANRMAMLPNDKHWLTGFRIVQADYPLGNHSLPTPVPYCMQNVNQVNYKWESPSVKAFFAEPLDYVIAPDCNSGTPFYRHNHCTAVIWCDNGDLLAVWFSADHENGREMTILGSRLRAGNIAWDPASEFFKVPDRNMTGSNLFHNGKGTLIFTNGVEAAGDWQNLAMVKRISTDNGATWSTPKLFAPEHKKRHQVIAGMIETREGYLIQLADATPESHGGTAMHLSKDGGETWLDAGEGKANDFVEGGTGGTIAGIHAGIVQLKDGSLMALGRGNSIKDKNGIDRMPMSVTNNWGETWHYSASEFPLVDGGQRLVLMRLNEGAILLVSFTHHPYRIKNGIKGMMFKDAQYKEFMGSGMYAALSFDEGKTWKTKKLITDGKERFLNGGAWTDYFLMTPTQAEPRGYLAVTQTPDNTIHLLSSKIHYRFNLQWLME